MIRRVEYCPLCFKRNRFVDDADNLCRVFTWAAKKTWKDLEDSHRLSAGISEDSITDMLLLDMRRRTNRLSYRRFTRHEEHRNTGADWLWWFVAGGKGFPLLVQSKRLYPSGRYESLKYARRPSDQTNTLLRHARRNRWFPIFCFYNYWHASRPWPSAPTYDEREQWGCAVAPAKSVKRSLRSASNGNSFVSIAPISVPWMRLVCADEGAEAIDEGAEDIVEPVDKRAETGSGLPDFVRSRVKRIFGVRAIPEIAGRLPPEVLQLLGERVEEDGTEPPEGLSFLDGMIVVSDKPIGRKD
jgi:hypothetical protein